MTANEAPDAEPDAAKGAIPLYSLERVLRATRMEPAAGRESRGDEALVASDQEGQDPAWPPEDQRTQETASSRQVRSSVLKSANVAW